MKAIEFDNKFDSGEDITDMLDLSNSKRTKQNPKRINLDMPLWMIEKVVPTSIDKLESFNSIVSQAFPNHKIIIDTTTNIFRTKYFELTKANSIKE